MYILVELSAFTNPQRRAHTHVLSRTLSDMIKMRHAVYSICFHPVSKIAPFLPFVTVHKSLHDIFS